MLDLDPVSDHDDEIAAVDVVLGICRRGCKSHLWNFDSTTLGVPHLGDDKHGSRGCSEAREKPIMLHHFARSHPPSIHSTSTSSRCASSLTHCSAASREWKVRMAAA